ncbi:MAG: ABC transporter permease, partial [Gemmatimonadaceae bacterium]|nr:ABC transporter permease [Gemmatimonadaceae bacterium]
MLLVLRDRGGVAILLVMPTAMVLITTLVQEDALRAVRGGRTTVLVAVTAGDGFGAAVATGLDGSGAFTVVRELRGRAVTAATIREELLAGNYTMGIVVPPGVAERVGAGADRLLARMMPAGMGPAVSVAEPLGEIAVYFDPAVRAPFRRAVITALERLSQGVEVKVMMGKIQGFMSGVTGKPSGKSSWEAEPHITVRELFTGQGGADVMPSSVQQNVPAWTLFAMFMISLPLSGGIIRERDGGTLVRLRTLPVAATTILAAKVLVYMGVCLLQFGFLMLIGAQLLPRLGTASLEVGTQYAAIGAAALAAAFAATGFGIMMGAINRTTEQSSVFCATAVVIAAALGGIMVPSFLMPAKMQLIGHLSPLQWGLSAFVDLF